MQEPMRSSSNQVCFSSLPLASCFSNTWLFITFCAAERRVGKAAGKPSLQLWPEPRRLLSCRSLGRLISLRLEFFSNQTGQLCCEAYMEQCTKVTVTVPRTCNRSLTNGCAFFLSSFHYTLRLLGLCVRLLGIFFHSVFVLGNTLPYFQRRSLSLYPGRAQHSSSRASFSPFAWFLCGITRPSPCLFSG